MVYKDVRKKDENPRGITRQGKRKRKIRQECETTNGKRIKKGNKETQKRYSIYIQR